MVIAVPQDAGRCRSRYPFVFLRLPEDLGNQLCDLGGGLQILTCTEYGKWVYIKFDPLCG